MRTPFVAAMLLAAVQVVIGCGERHQDHPQTTKGSRQSGTATAFGRLPQGTSAIALDEVELWLGMPEDRALAALAVGRKVEDQGQGQFMISKGDTVIGQVTFENAAITRVAKMWGHVDPSDEAARIAEMLFHAVAHVSKDKPTTARVYTQTYHEPGENRRSVFLEFPDGRKIEFRIIADLSRGAGVTEIIGDSDN